MLLVSKLAGTIDDETLRRIKRLYPRLDKCPTCEGKGKFVLDSVTYECDCPSQILLQKHYYAANIGRTYHTLCRQHFVSVDKDLLVEKIDKYLEDWDNNRYYGHGLTFNGNVGTGKTFAMSYILKELIKQGVSAYFITFDEMVNVFGSVWNNDESKFLDMRLRTVDILGIDELRTDQRNAEGFLSQVAENIIRHRATNLLPTMITTNMTPEQETMVFNKSYSLLSALNERVTPQGTDVRGQIIREREFTMKGRDERRPVC